MKITKKKVVWLTIAVILLVALGFGLKYLSDTKAYKDKVAVTMKSGRIQSIDLLEHRNERGASAEVLTEKIVSAQSLEVDAISGATNSSKVIKKAVENALKK